MPNIDSVSRVIFISDLFKVDDRAADRSMNPQRINIEWIHALFSPLLQQALQVSTTLITGEEVQHPLNRVSFYHRKKLPMTSAGWAAIYEDLDCTTTAGAIVQALESSLVIGFEMPPYLIRILTDASIPYVDLGIHPIRYLPDYIFGIRSNSSAIHERIVKSRIPEAVFTDFARISAARTVRVMRGWRPQAGSALFLGQIEVDASLIHKGRVFDIGDVEAQLLELLQSYPKIYYKFHPHRKEKASVEKFLKAHPSFAVADVNIYDGLACPEFLLVCSLSSGALLEAKRFGKNTSRLLENFNAYDLDSGIEVGRHYLPAPFNIFSEQYWKFLIGNTPSFEAKVPDACDGALKFSLNQKWGR